MDEIAAGPERVQPVYIGASDQDNMACAGNVRGAVPDKGGHMRQSYKRSPYGIHHLRLFWLAISAVAAVLSGVLVFAGTSDARSDVPCKPSARHPHPVVLVHGTFETMDQN